jgi:hypothetical protein
MDVFREALHLIERSRASVKLLKVGWPMLMYLKETHEIVALLNCSDSIARFALFAKTKCRKSTLVKPKNEMVNQPLNLGSKMRIPCSERLQDEHQTE